MDGDYGEDGLLVLLVMFASTLQLPKVENFES